MLVSAVLHAVGHHLAKVDVVGKGLVSNDGAVCILVIGAGDAVISVAGVNGLVAALIPDRVKVMGIGVVSILDVSRIWMGDPQDFADALWRRQPALISGGVIVGVSH